MAKAVDSAAETKSKICFIITPLGPVNSETRKKAEGLIRTIIKPSLEEFHFGVISPHEISERGSITNQIISHLLNDDLVIANLTDLNPNVMYELAVRHACRKPVISLMEGSRELPFDIKDERTIIFTDEIAEVTRLRKELSSAIQSTIENPIVDNPIYRYKEQSIMQEIVQGTPFDYIIKKLDEIEQITTKNRPYPVLSSQNVEYYKTSILLNSSKAELAFNEAYQFNSEIANYKGIIQLRELGNERCAITYYYPVNNPDLGSQMYWHIEKKIGEARFNPSTSTYDKSLNLISY
ncbi:MAG: hypothetical protein V1775_02725 [Bacteroidota bacterium]